MSSRASSHSASVPCYALSFPRRLSDGILLNPNSGDSSVKVTQLAIPDGPQSSPVEFGDMSFFPESKNFLLAFAGGGFFFLEVIEDADSPEAFQYRIDIGRDQTISPDGSGGYTVFNKDGEHVVSLGVPWALDSDGIDVPVRYTLDDAGVLSLEVDHRGMDYAYPIFADPCWAFWSDSCRPQVIEYTVVAAVTSAGAATGATVVAAIIAPPAAPVTLTAGVLLVAGTTIGGGLFGAIACILTCDP